jgi:hypothetical protein
MLFRRGVQFGRLNTAPEVFEALSLASNGSGWMHEVVQYGLQMLEGRAVPPVSCHNSSKSKSRLTLSMHHVTVPSRTPSEGTTADPVSDEDDPNESRYLGQNSIAALLSEETRAGETVIDGEQDVIRKDIMPILGLQISSAPYPFMSKEHMDKIRPDIAPALPSDREVLKYVHPLVASPSRRMIGADLS